MLDSYAKEEGINIDKSAKETTQIAICLFQWNYRLCKNNLQQRFMNQSFPCCYIGKGNLIHSHPKGRIYFL
jgi:hypothetical protein